MNDIEKYFDVKNKLEQAAGKKRGLELTLSMAVGLKEVLPNQIKQLENEITAKTAQLNAADEQIANLPAQIQEADDEISKINETYVKFEAEYDKIKDTNAPTSQAEEAAQAIPETIGTEKA